MSSITRFGHQVTMRYSDRGKPYVSPDPRLIGPCSTGILAEFSDHDGVCRTAIDHHALAFFSYNG